MVAWLDKLTNLSSSVRAEVSSPESSKKETTQLGFVGMGSRTRTQRSSWITSNPEVMWHVHSIVYKLCIKGGFEGLENGPKQRRINNRLLSYRPKSRNNNLEILA